MNSDTAQQSGGYPWQQPLNQSVENLTKAIALQESGGGGTSPNYEAVGDNGTSTGGYQWQPGNFAAMAEKYGLDPNNFSPENQDKTAYSQIYTLAKEGYSPENIAASWNMGPSGLVGDTWKTHKGTTEINGKQISYNTPQYVQNVQNIYNKLAASQQTTSVTTPNASSTPKTSWVSSLESDLGKWGPWILGGLGLASIGTVTAGIGDLPFLGAAAADAGIGAAEATGAAADAGAVAADTSAAAKEGGGLLSKIFNFGKTAAKDTAIAGGIDYAANTAKNIILGDQQSTGNTSNPLSNESFNLSSQASGALKQAQQDALSATQANRVFAQTSDAQQGINANATYGTVAQDNGNGIYDATTANKKAMNIIGDVSNALSQSLDAEGTHTNMSVVEENALQDMRAHTPIYEQDQAESHIKALVEQYGKQFADEDGNISLGNVERMRKEMGRAVHKWDGTKTSAQQAAYKGMYFGGRRTVEANTENKHLYNLAMKEEQALINGMKVNKRLNGKVIKKKDSLVKKGIEAVAQYASIAIGDKIGGPLGAVVGAVVGHSLEKGIEKKFGKNLLDTKSVKKAMEILKEKRPEVEALLQKTIKKYSNRKEAEKEYRVIEKKDTPQQISKDEMAMGTSKLGKNKSTGRVQTTGFYKKPGGAIVNSTGIESNTFKKRKR